MFLMKFFTSTLLAHIYPYYGRIPPVSSELDIQAEGERMGVVHPNVAPYDVRMWTGDVRHQSDFFRMSIL
jgi:hypothetical protein